MATPRKGIHSIRVLDIAVVDVFGAMLAAYAVSRQTGWNLAWASAIVFALGVLAHRLFRIRTKVDEMLFG